MAKTQSSNYTASNTDFQIPGADSDTFDRNDITKLGQALEEHTHASTRGIQIPTGGIADSAVTAAKLASDAVTTAKILDANVTAAKLASDAVTTAKILDANVTTAKINDGAVTAAKLSGSTVLVTKRQGGSATDWNTVGTNNYTPVTAIIQVGNADADANGTISVTFPEAFGGVPIVTVTPDSGIQLTCSISSASTTGFTAQITVHYADPVTPHAAASTLDTVNWIAIGPPA